MVEPISVVAVPLLTKKVGAVLTFEPTVMPIVSTSCNDPPLPVLPWSSVVIVIVAVPLKEALGVKVSPSRDVLMSSIVPVKVMSVSSVPSPTEKIKGGAENVFKNTPEESPTPSPSQTTVQLPSVPNTIAGRPWLLAVVVLTRKSLVRILPALSYYLA